MTKIIAVLNHKGGVSAKKGWVQEPDVFYF